MEAECVSETSVSTCKSIRRQTQDFNKNGNFIIYHSSAFTVYETIFFTTQEHFTSLGSTTEKRPDLKNKPNKIIIPERRKSRITSHEF
jgi:hypothetical protein